MLEGTLEFYQLNANESVFDSSTVMIVIIFVFRRAFLIWVALGCIQSTIKLQIFALLNIFITIFIGYKQRYIQRKNWWLELFNEAMIQLLTISRFG